MDNKEKVIENLNTAKYILNFPQILNHEMCIKIGQAISAAIALLKEPETVKPETFKHEDGWIEYYCGNCKAYLLQDNAEVRSIIWRPKYCSTCGKAVKWDDG